jgi:hypothetical protein
MGMSIRRRLCGLIRARHVPWDRTLRISDMPYASSTMSPPRLFSIPLATTLPPSVSSPFRKLSRLNLLSRSYGGNDSAPLSLHLGGSAYPYELFTWAYSGSRGRETREAREVDAKEEEEENSLGSFSGSGGMIMAVRARGRRWLWRLVLVHARLSQTRLGQKDVEWIGPVAI